METDPERDLGVAVGSSMKMSTQCTMAIKQADALLGAIRKGAENESASIRTPLYESISTHLESCLQFWSPHLYKRQCSFGERAEKGDSNDCGNGTLILWRKIEEVRAL